MTYIELIFWLNALWIFFTYVGYPIFLYIFTSVSAKPWKTADTYPPVTIYVAAFNESDAIQDRIENIKSLQYPGQLDIIIADDGSTDGTAELARASLGSLGRVERSPVNVGKTAMQNRIVPQIENDIVVFADATSKWPTDLIAKLVRNFEDPDVGCVAADIRFQRPGHGEGVHEQGAYWRYERMLRILGSRIWTNVVVSGTCYAIRRELFSELPPEIAEDLGTPLSIGLQGYRVVFDPDAVVLEESALSDQQEGRMRRRIALQNITAISRYIAAIIRGPRFLAFQFFAHKVMRSYCWVAMLVLFLANIALVNQHWFYVVTLVSQVASYGMAGIGYLANARCRKSGVVNLAKYFFLLNMVYGVAQIDYLRGERSASWKTDR